MTASVKLGIFAGGWHTVEASLGFDAFTSIRLTAERNGGICYLSASPPTHRNVTFFAIQSTNYTNLHILIDGVRDYKVTGPLMLIDRAQVCLLHSTISDIAVTNYDTVSDADVQIYIGRDASIGSIFGLYFYKDSNSMYAGAL